MRGMNEMNITIKISSRIFSGARQYGAFYSYKSRRFGVLGNAFANLNTAVRSGASFL